MRIQNLQLAQDIVKTATSSIHQNIVNDATTGSSSKVQKISSIVAISTNQKCSTSVLTVKSVSDVTILPIPRIVAIATL